MATVRYTGNNKFHLDMSEEREQARKEQRAYAVGNFLGAGAAQVAFSRRLRYLVQVPLHFLFAWLVSAAVLNVLIHLVPISTDNRSAIHAVNIIGWGLAAVVGAVWTAFYVKRRTIPKMRRVM